MITLPNDIYLATRLSRDSVTLCGHTDPVLSANFSNDGMLVVSGSSDRSIKIWHSVTGECVKTLIGHTKSISACQFSPDNTQILSGSDDKTLRIWDVQTGQIIRVFEGHHSWINCCTYSKDGSQIVSGSHGGEIKIWENDTGKCVKTINTDDSVFSCCFYLHEYVITSGYNSIKIYSTITGECITKLVETNTRGVYFSFCTSPNGLFMAYSNNNDIVITNTSTDSRIFLNHSRAACNFSPDSKLIISCGDPNIIKIWDIATGVCIKSYFIHETLIRGCNFSPDGTRIISYSADKTIVVSEFRNNL